MRLSNASPLAIAAVVVGAASAAGAATAMDDFSIANGNPNGAWTYGLTAGVGAAVAPFDLTATSATIDYWHTSANLNALVGKNTGATLAGGTVLYPAGEVVMHPAINNLAAVVRYTVPTLGLYAVAGAFARADTTSLGNGVDVSIAVNGVSVYDKALDTDYGAATAAGSYASPVPLLLPAGSTIDFIVGSAGAYTFDSTTLSASVGVAPEPAALAAVVAAGGHVLRRRRRA